MTEQPEYPISEEILRRAKTSSKGISVDLLMELSRGAQLPEQIKPFLFGQLISLLFNKEADARLRPYLYLIGFLSLLAAGGWILAYQLIFLKAIGVW